MQVSSVGGAVGAVASDAALRNATAESRPSADGSMLGWVKAHPVAIAIGAAAIAGTVFGVHHLTHRGIPAPLVDAIDGVKVLDNPCTPLQHHVRWGIPKGGTVFAGGGTQAHVSLSEVDQGRLGDCYFTAAMGSLADRAPETLTSRIIERPDGVIIKLPGGDVAVDRNLPLRSDGGPIYMGKFDKDKVLWPAYMEKAFAATEGGGSYHAIEGGNASTGYRWLTGVSPKRITPPTDVIADIEQRFARGEPVTVTSMPEQSALMDELGVHSDHVYVAQTIGADADQKLLQLFNPWGRDQPKPITGDQLHRMFNEVETTAVRYSV